MFVQLLPLLELPTLPDGGYTYKQNPSLAPLSVGQLVHISFGRQAKIAALVLQTENVPPPPPSVFCKPVEGIISPEPVIPPNLLARLRQMAHFTGTPVATTVLAALPGHFLTAKPHHFTPPRTVVYGIASHLTPTSALTNEATAGLSKRQCSVLQTLFNLHQQHIQQSPNTPAQWTAASLMDTCHTTKATLNNLVQAGCLYTTEVTHYRDPLRLLMAPPPTDKEPPPTESLESPKTSNTSESSSWFTLNAQQQAVVEAVAASPNEAFLLHGVTGAGKTEVYMQLALDTLKQGKQVLVLVPEIALTGALAQRFVKRFGLNTVTLWHSQLSQGERSDTWFRIQHGQAGIVIAARSGIFTPIEALGLIIIDECHDDSFKQDQPSPRYDARTLARWWHQQQGCALVMGSATPTVVQYYEATEQGSLRLLELTERYGTATLPDSFLVDMREEKRKGLGNHALAEPCMQALQHTLAQGEQAIILINRRGYHTHVQCADCGHVFQCPQCSVGVTYHNHEQEVKCHHCGYRAEVPRYCTACAGQHIQRSGAGTQRVEEELRRVLPSQTRLLRLDGDVLQQRHALPTILGAFGRGEADVLIGTQLVAKGLDVANVTLVIMLNTDAGLSLPDYKTLERGYQLISQVSGRAGRGTKKGRVYLQTYQPEHPVIQFAKHTNYQGFYQYDLRQRESCHFPPFGLLMRLIVASEEAERTHQFAIGLKHHLLQYVRTVNDAYQEPLLQLLGPVPCMIERLQGFVRQHLLIKLPSTSNTSEAMAMKQAVADWYRTLQIPEGIRCALDTDCQSLF